MFVTSKPIGYALYGEPHEVIYSQYIVYMTYGTMVQWYKTFMLYKSLLWFSKGAEGDLFS